MIYPDRETILKTGQRCLLRNARPADGADLLVFLKESSSETPFLMRDPEEITLTMQQELQFIKERAESERELLLIACVDGRHAGNCSLSSLGGYHRCAHRCSIAIALYQKYCGLGIGKMMLTEILDAAVNCGYEQAELEVATTNENALRLYTAMGFEIYGTQPHSMKYKDGTYADEYLMQKKLQTADYSLTL